MFPFSVAKKLPVYFYGKVFFQDLSGVLEIQGEVFRGMIGFGQKFETTTKPKGIAVISIAGKLVCKGYVRVGNDYLISVTKNAYCEFGHRNVLGSDVKVVCTQKIVLNDYVGVGYESQLIDTNSHPFMNTVTEERYPIQEPIFISDFNAISNRVSVMPGTITPKNCIVASNSLLTKDYTDLGENILIGGIPSKLLKENFNRDWQGEEKQMKQFLRIP